MISQVSVEFRTQPYGEASCPATLAGVLVRRFTDRAHEVRALTRLDADALFATLSGRAVERPDETVT